jgi:hypothetical protein
LPENGKLELRTEKHASLLQDGINYDRKSFIEQAPGGSQKITKWSKKCLNLGGQIKFKIDEEIQRKQVETNLK